MTKPKPDPGTLELEGSLQELKRFYRVTLSRGEDKCPACGRQVEGRPYGNIFIPKALGIPKLIVINVIPRKEED